jgi:hypothetical protein
MDSVGIFYCFSTCLDICENGHHFHNFIFQRAVKARIIANGVDFINYIFEWVIFHDIERFKNKMNLVRAFFTHTLYLIKSSDFYHKTLQALSAKVMTRWNNINIFHFLNLNSYPPEQMLSTLQLSTRQHITRTKLRSCEAIEIREFRICWDFQRLKK